MEVDANNTFIDWLSDLHMYNNSVLATPAWYPCRQLKDKYLGGIAMKSHNASGFLMKIHAIRNNGVILTDNKVIDTLTLSGSTNLTDLHAGTTITGKTSNATSTVASINGNTIGLGAVTGTFQVGEQLLFTATKTSSTLFTTHDATGLIIHTCSRTQLTP